MTVFEAIYSLRATRIYEDRPVPPEVLDQILQAGTMACSSGNTQPWELILVTDVELKRRIKVEMVDAFATIDAERAQKPEDLLDGAGRPVTGHGTLRATREIPGGRGVSLFQACQNMLLAGRALGVSSLFATFFFLRNDEIKEILGIPPHIFMECCLFFGYADETLGRPRRKPLSEVAHVNGWGNRYELATGG